MKELNGIAFTEKISFTRYSYVVYFKALTKYIDKKSFCITYNNIPLNCLNISLLLKRSYQTIHRFLKEARAKQYLTAAYNERQMIYFINPNIIKFKGKKDNQAVLYMFKKIEEL